MKGTAPSGRIWRGGTAYLALKRQAIQIPPFQGEGGDKPRLADRPGCTCHAPTSARACRRSTRG